MVLLSRLQIKHKSLREVHPHTTTALIAESDIELRVGQALTVQRCTAKVSKVSKVRRFEGSTKEP